MGLKTEEERPSDPHVSRFARFRGIDISISREGFYAVRSLATAPLPDLSSTSPVRLSAGAWKRDKRGTWGLREGATGERKTSGRRETSLPNRNFVREKIRKTEGEARREGRDRGRGGDERGSCTDPRGINLKIYELNGAKVGGGEGDRKGCSSTQRHSDV